MIELTPEKQEEIRNKLYEACTHLLRASKIMLGELEKRLGPLIMQGKLNAQTFIGIEDDCIVEGIAVIPHYSSEDLYTIDTTQVGGYR